MNNVVLYCRPGFEKECAAEITEKAAEREIYGFARVKENSGYVVFVCYQHEEAGPAGARFAAAQSDFCASDDAGW